MIKRLWYRYMTIDRVKPAYFTNDDQDESSVGCLQRPTHEIRFRLLRPPGSEGGWCEGCPHQASRKNKSDKKWVKQISSWLYTNPPSLKLFFCKRIFCNIFWLLRTDKIKIYSLFIWAFLSINVIVLWVFKCSMSIDIT